MLGEFKCEQRVFVHLFRRKYIFRHKRLDRVFKRTNAYILANLF